jgi:exo-beta-1,3-glucanase (GH17 family)
MRIAITLLGLTSVVIVGIWSFLGAAIDMPASPLAAGEKLYCVSYAPFRGDQNPFGPDIPIDPRQIEQDLAQLRPFTDCIRTYSIDHGLDQIPGIAARQGMKVLQGLWLSNRPDWNQRQIDTTVALVKRYPDVIAAVVVGNEVLLRGEMSVPDLARTIREVKSQVAVPVTYADVWEFWLRNRELASAVDFVTVHILPFWEDFPIPVGAAAAHVDSIRRQVAAAFPDRDVLVGEFGWPSAGRMREAARPSPADQARILAEVVALSRRDNFRLNLIEAYDQPWKRQLEGTVGGHWGIFDAYRRAPKFVFGQAVSNHPDWRLQAAGGVGFAVAMFGAAGLGRRFGNRAAAAKAKTANWIRIAAMAIVSGTLISWTIADVPTESLTPGDWLRSLAWAAVAALMPLAAAAAIAAGAQPAPLERVLAHRDQRETDPLRLWLGVLTAALLVLALQAALGLVFDPRYRDVPFAPLTAALVPLLLLRPCRLPRINQSISAELVAAAILVVSAAYVVLNEAPANWQAAWFCAALVGLAITVAPVRDVPD